MKKKSPPKNVKPPVPLSLISSIREAHQKREDSFNTQLQNEIDVNTDIGFFAFEMAIQSLIEKETEIIRDEWHAKRGQANVHADPQAVTKYVAMRKALKEKSDLFEDRYEVIKKVSNECARSNLDNMNGRAYCYVLPEFNDDGTHAPIGDKDGPWGVKE